MEKLCLGVCQWVQGPWSQTAWVQILTLPLNNSCVTLGIYFTLPGHPLFLVFSNSLIEMYSRATQSVQSKSSTQWFYHIHKTWPLPVKPSHNSPGCLHGRFSHTGSSMQACRPMCEKGCNSRGSCHLRGPGARGASLNTVNPLTVSHLPE